MGIRSTILAYGAALIVALSGCGSQAQGQAVGASPTTSSSFSAPPPTSALSPAGAASVDPSSYDGAIELAAGKGDEALAKDFVIDVQRWSDVGTSGANDYYNKNGIGRTVEQIANELAQQNRAGFSDILFDKQSLTNTDVDKYIRDSVIENAKVLKYALLTDPSISPANEEFYRLFYELNSPVKRITVDGDTRTLQFETKSHSNYAKTSYKDKQTDSDDTLYTVFTVSFKHLGSAEKITSISTQSHK